MIYRHFLLVLLLLTARSAHSQETTLRDTIPVRPITIPSPEEFVNAVFHTIVGASWSHYYLVAGTDSCRFTKYNYEEWVKYTLKEPVPLPVLNELSEKVYHAGTPYFWKQNELQGAICITRKQGDSIIYPASNRRTPYGRPTKKQPRKKGIEPDNRPEQDTFVYSFSLPQFTDDGQYAVIDLNFVCGIVCGEGFTCLFHRSPSGWKLIGQYTNWSS
jgi:hypothetical protein